MKNDIFTQKIRQNVTRKIRYYDKKNIKDHDKHLKDYYCHYCDDYFRYSIPIKKNLG